MGTFFFLSKTFQQFCFTMPKELYLYSQIYSFIAEKLISQMEDVGSDSDITLRINSGGGDVFAGFGIMAKIKERTGKTNMKVDGMAASMSAILLCFGDYVECLDTSTLMLHRAVGDRSTPEDIALVDSVNSSLRAQLTKKIDAVKLKELKGITIKNLFEDEKRIDLFLTAKEAKAIGLVDKINPLSPKEATAFSERMLAIAASYTSEEEEEEVEEITATTKTTKKIITMDVQKLKTEFPKVYAEIFGLGVAQEKDRVEAALVYNELDPAGVKAIIESGKPLTQKQMAEFSLKAISGKTLEAVKKDSQGNVITEEETKEKTEKEKVLADFEKSLDATLKLKTV